MTMRRKRITKDDWFRLALFWSEEVEDFSAYSVRDALGSLGLTMDLFAISVSKSQMSVSEKLGTSGDIGALDSWYIRAQFCCEKAGLA